MFVLSEETIKDFYAHLFSKGTKRISKKDLLFLKNRHDERYLKEFLEFVLYDTPHSPIQNLNEKINVFKEKF